MLASWPHQSPPSGFRHSAHCPPLSQVIGNAPGMVEIHNAHKRVERSHDDCRPLLGCGEAGRAVVTNPWEGSRPQDVGRERGCGDESPTLMRPSALSS
jgi:hypothetical protein